MRFSGSLNAICQIALFNHGSNDYTLKGGILSCHIVPWMQHSIHGSQGKKRLEEKKNKIWMGKYKIVNYVESMKIYFLSVQNKNELFFFVFFRSFK